MRLEQRLNVPREERLQRNRRRHVHRVFRDQLLERRQRLGRGRKRAAGVELQRARQPVTQRRRQRLLFAERSTFTRLIEEVRQPVRKLFDGQRPAEEQRQRDQPHAGDVRPVIEPRRAGARRHRDPELIPQALARELELLDRGGDDVLDDDEPRMRGHDQALGRDQAVRDVARILVPQRDRRHQLANQADGGVDVQLQPALVRDAENVREPRALDMIRHDRETRRGDLHAIDPAHPGVIGVAEIRQPRRPLAQRKLERRHRRKRRVDFQDLEELAGRAIGRHDAVPDAVTEQWRLRAVSGHRSGVHWGDRQPCNRKSSFGQASRIGRNCLFSRDSGPLATPVRAAPR
jgi:hypothetical protein